MSLYTRFIGIDVPRISVHTFYALAHEVQRTQITGLQAANLLGLSVAERDEAQTLFQRVTSGSLTPEEVHQVLMIASSGIGLYNTEATLKARLGVA